MALIDSSASTRNPFWSCKLNKCFTLYSGSASAGVWCSKSVASPSWIHRKLHHSQVMALPKNWWAVNGTWLHYVMSVRKYKTHLSHEMLREGCQQFPCGANPRRLLGTALCERKLNLDFTGKCPLEIMAGWNGLRSFVCVRRWWKSQWHRKSVSSSTTLCKPKLTCVLSSPSSPSHLKKKRNSR